jgi:antitoxin MazE
VKARLVPIGNSRGVRLPKALIAQCDLGEVVELEVADGCIVIRPAPAPPRDGWDDAFGEMAARGDDRLLDEGP